MSALFALLCAIAENLKEPTTPFEAEATMHDYGCLIDYWLIQPNGRKLHGLCRIPVG